MNRAIRLMKKGFYSLLILFILLAGLLGFLLFTTPGLYTGIQLAKLVLPGSLHTQHVRGQLGNAFEIGQLIYQDNQQQIQLQQLRLKWHPQDLLKAKLLIQSIDAEKILLKTDSRQQKQQQSDTAADTPLTSFPELPVAIELQQLNIKQLSFIEGKKQQHFNDIHAQLSLDKQQWQLKTFALRYHQQQINSQLKLQAQYPYQLKGYIHLRALNNLQGEAIQGNLYLSGNYQQYQWQGAIQHPSKINIHGRLKKGKQIHSLLRWQQLNWPISKKKHLESSQGQLELKGTLPQLNIKLSSRLESPLEGHLDAHFVHRLLKQQASFRLSGEQGLIQGSFRRDRGQKKTVSGEINGQWQALDELVAGLSQLKINAQFKGNDLDNLSLRALLEANYWKQPVQARMNYNNALLNAFITLGKNQLNISGGPDFKWKIKGSLPELSLLNPQLEGLKGSLNIDGIMNSPQQGQLNILLHPGSYQPPEHGGLAPLNFRGGRVAAKLSQTGLQASGIISIDPEKKINLNFSMPGLNFAEGINDDQTMDLELELIMNSLAFLSQISPEIEKSSGQMNVKLKSSGNIKHLQTELHAKLSNLSASLPAPGLKLEQGELSINADHQHWALQAMIYSAGRPLRLTGKGSHFPSPEGQLELKGDSVQLMNSKDYIIYASPDLKISYQNQLVNVTGAVHIPEATISPQTFSDSVSLSDDVVFKNKEDKRSSDKLALDVAVTMGDKVNLDIQGLKGQLVGSIQLRQQPRGALTASGNLHVAKGAYRAHGQELKIEQGDLFFSGGLITNPGINIRAVRQFNNTQSAFSGSNQWFDFTNSNVQNFNFSSQVTVGIQVTGRLTSPKVSLFSSPPGLSQADILSMLILGRPAHQAGESGGQLLLAAVSSMKLDSGTGGNQMLSQLQENLGLDFDIQGSSSYNRETNTVKESKKVHIGKKVSKRIYVSYDLGLFQSDTSVFSLKYLLNKYFSIQVNASDSANGLDVYYTRQIN